MKLDLCVPIRLAEGDKILFVGREHLYRLQIISSKSLKITMSNTQSKTTRNVGEKIIGAEQIINSCLFSDKDVIYILVITNLKVVCFQHVS
jgi:hypothetical protein